MFIYNALSKRGKEKKKSDIVEDSVPLAAPRLESPDKVRLQEDPVSRKRSNGPSAAKLKKRVFKCCHMRLKIFSLFFKMLYIMYKKLIIHMGEKEYQATYFIYLCTDSTMVYSSKIWALQQGHVFEEFNIYAACIRPFFFSIPYLRNEQTGRVAQVFSKTGGKCYMKQSSTFFCFSPFVAESNYLKMISTLYFSMSTRHWLLTTISI